MLTKYLFDEYKCIFNKVAFMKKKDIQKPELVTIKELETEYNLGRGAFNGMLKNGLKTIKMPGLRGRRLIRRTELEKYLKKHES